MGVDLPALAWGPSPDQPFHGGSKHPHLRDARRKPVEVMSKAERIVTPPAFRDLLLGMARTARAPSLARCG